WTIITLVPADAYLWRVRAVQNIVLTLALAAGLLSVYLGYRLARRIARPVVAISQFAQRIGEGDYDARVALSASRERRRLAEDLNRMAVDVQRRVELEKEMVVAAQIQKTLLPARDPKRPDLEVAGRSIYATGAGGDYYDFLEVTRGGRRCLLVAVGDAMGHGV